MLIGRVSYRRDLPSAAMFGPRLYRIVCAPSQNLIRLAARNSSSVEAAATDSTVRIVHPAFTIPKATNPVAQEFNELVFKSRGVNKLSLRNFVFLVDKINTAEEIKYGVRAADLYQKKGNDFSELANATFINACIRSKSPQAALDIFRVFPNRLGAWTTPSSCNRLLRCCAEHGVTEHVLDTVAMLKKKGLPLNSESYKTLHQLAEKTTDEIVKTAFVEFIKRDLGSEGYDNLVNESKKNEGD